MKLKFLVGSLLLAGFLVGSASAQGVHAGLETGANFSTALGSDIQSINSSRLGFVGGAFLDLDLSKQFGFRIEALYSQKGGQDSGGNNGFQLDDLEIPVLVKTSLGTPGINPSLFVGGVFSANLAAQVVNDGISSTASDASATDIGLVGGIQVNFDKFFVNGRYELGLSNVTTDSNIQNGTITFMAGYSFL